MHIIQYHVFLNAYLQAEPFRGGLGGMRWFKLFIGELTIFF